MRSVEELIQWVTAEEGIAHSTAARAEGFTMHGMRAAVADERLHRVRRSWLAAPDCDPELRRAAEEGSRSTCVSEAARLELWTPNSDRVHLSVSPAAARRNSTGVRFHWSPGPSPVSLTAVREPLINVLHHVAQCVSFIDALAVWESAIRKKAIDRDVLARIDWRGPAARRIAAVASDLSDSGIETGFIALMQSIGVAVRQQVRVDGHRLDGVIGEHLAIQLDGFAHHQAADRRRDLRADARLVLRGFTVLRFDYYQVLFAPGEVIAIVSAAIAQGKHR